VRFGVFARVPGRPMSPDGVIPTYDSYLNGMAVASMSYRVVIELSRWHGLVVLTCRVYSYLDVLTVLSMAYRVMLQMLHQWHDRCIDSIPIYDTYLDCTAVALMSYRVMTVISMSKPWSCWHAEIMIFISMP
jgi:hypothetical protein